MLTSSFALQARIGNLQVEIAKLKQARKSGAKTSPRAMWQAILGFILALLFFMVELYLLFYTLKYVFVSTPAGPARNIKIVLLVFFTMPFALLSAIVDPNFASMVNKH